MNEIQTTRSARSIGIAAKVGAWLLVLWGVLHMWVGVEGLRLYVATGTPGMWNMVGGGRAVPSAAFVHATDPVTLFAHGQLLLNFFIDVGGYGVLGFFAAWLILKQGSWTGYFIAAVVIGIADLAFLFTQVLSGVAPMGFPQLIGPILWFLAVALTPFGLPKLGSRQA